MSSNRRLNAIVVSGGLLIAVTAVLFFVSVSEPSNLQWVSCAIVLFSELLIVGVLSLMERRSDDGAQLFFRSGMYSSLAVYAALSMGTAFLFMVGVLSRMKWLIAAEFVWLCFFAIAFVVLSTTGGAIAASNDRATGERSQETRSAKRGGY